MDRPMVGDDTQLHPDILARTQKPGAIGKLCTLSCISNQP